MCGLVGVLKSHGNNVNEKEIIEARNIISYRGPDDSGIYINNNIGLGHVRLSIIDLSDKAAQPMISASGRFVIAYNGEIYNYGALRNRLLKKGINFRSTGDTETILEYIEGFGIKKCLQEIEGMFAFALWDKREKILTLARDRYGIKPLYFSTIDNIGIFFASEMKVLLKYSYGPDFTTVNAAMLGLGCAWDSNTLLKNIESVRAGERITFGDDGKIIQKDYFFRLPDFVDEKSYQEIQKGRALDIVERTNEAMIESMRLCMISDAPVAVLASGGIDSSLISALANRTNPDLKLFHANVVGASETDAATTLSKYLGCDLFTATVTEQDTLDYTPEVTYHYEMPLMYHTNAVPFYLVSKLASSHGIKVVLTGEGADEHFIGYAEMAIWPFIQRYRMTLEKIQDLFHRINGLGKVFWPKMKDDLAQQLKKTIFRYELENRRKEAESTYNFINKWAERLLCYMSLDMCEGNIPPLLHRNDRLGMAWGLESRFPFLGHKIANLAFNMHPKFKVHKTFRFYDWRHPFIVDKWCIRKVAEKYLPNTLVYRGKYAFRAVVYNRLNISSDFFKNGFVSDFYGLNFQSIKLMLENSSISWKSRMFLLEIWGRLFSHKENIINLKEHINRYVSYSQRGQS